MKQEAWRSKCLSEKITNNLFLGSQAHTIKGKAHYSQYLYKFSLWLKMNLEDRNVQINRLCGHWLKQSLYWYHKSQTKTNIIGRMHEWKRQSPFMSLRFSILAEINKVKQDFVNESWHSNYLNTVILEIIGGNMITWLRIVSTTIFASRLEVVNRVRWPC